MAELFLADLDRAVMAALEDGARVIDELIAEINCAPVEIKDTLQSLRRMGLAACESADRWMLTAQGRKLAP